MAEFGSFRVAFKGFNKADVLEYIDDLKSLHADETRMLQQQIEKLQETFTANESENSELKSQNEQLVSELNKLNSEAERFKQYVQEKQKYEEDLSRLKREVEVLRQEKKQLFDRNAAMQEKVTAADELKRQIEALKEENRRFNKCRQSETARIDYATKSISVLKEENKKLRTKLEDAGALAEQLKEQIRQQKKRISELQIHIDNMSESNKRYDVLVGDAGAFIMEMYSMGQHFLEIAYKRSDGCLDEMESSLISLSQQANNAREQVKKARQELLDYGAVAGLRLDELMQSLEDSAGALSSNAGKSAVNK
ncbi:MAG: hypothetical protein PHX02_07430 [Oscillospiraceae bacterium]|nr:hypothetical protein [Oscillospiraceae bacterium]